MPKIEDYKPGDKWLTRGNYIATIVRLIRDNEGYMVVDHNDGLDGWTHTLDGKINNIPGMIDRSLIRKLDINKDPEYFL